MSLVQMSFSGAVMILLIIVIRALFINKLPKKAFLALWGIVLLRLLIPFSLPSVLSAYSFVARNAPERVSDATVNIMPITNAGQMAITGDLEAVVSSGIKTSMLLIIWGVGMLSFLCFFTISYFRCCKEFQTSIPINNEYINRWLETHKIARLIKIRQLGRISTPLTYGVFHPIILMPKETDWNNSKQLQYVLEKILNRHMLLH